jgi:hypothetical protein
MNRLVEPLEKNRCECGTIIVLANLCRDDRNPLSPKKQFGEPVAAQMKKKSSKSSIRRKKVLADHGIQQPAAEAARVYGVSFFGRSNKSHSFFAGRASSTGSGVQRVVEKSSIPVGIWTCSSGPRKKSAHGKMTVRTNTHCCWFHSCSIETFEQPCMAAEMRIFVETPQ